MKGSRKRILILGVGSAQADAIRHAKDMDCEVFAVAHRKEGAGLAFVDHFEEINIVDRERVLAHAKKIACDAVYSVGSDIAMPTVGYVAERLGLPCLAPRAIAELLQNKGRLRSFLRDQKLSPVPFLVVGSEAEAAGWTRFPAIVKPVDSQGGRGVAVAHARGALEGLIDAALPFSRSGQAIVEQYVSGPEFSINLFLRAGRVAGAFVTDRFVDMAYPCGVVIGHGIPARIPDVVAGEAVRLASDIVRRLGLRDGPAYFQMKYSGDEVFVIEVTPRLDGCHIWRLIKCMYGVDLLDASLRLALGQDADLPPDPKPKHASLHLDFFVQKPDAPFSKQSEDPAALFLEWYFKEGEPVHRINGFAEKTGYQIRPACRR